MASVALLPRPVTVKHERLSLLTTDLLEALVDVRPVAPIAPGNR
ncbi:hypothetical protein AB0C89_31030 [Streptomyces sp. NPDC048491]